MNLFFTAKAKWSHWISNAVPSLMVVLFAAIPASAGTINIFGLPNTSQGNATLNVVGGSLVVSNIGSSGDDGVLVTLPSQTTYFDAHFNPLAPQSLNPGSVFQVTGLGTINGIPNQTTATAQAVDMGSQWALNFNFSNITSGDLEAYYYLGGVLVATAPALGPSGTLLMEPNAAISWGGTDARECSTCLKSVVITAAKPTNFTDFFSNLILADTVDVVTSSFDVPFDGFDTGVLLTASGISTLTINNEELTVATSRTH